MLPEFLYKLTERDEVGNLIQMRTFSEVTSGLFTGLNHTPRMCPLEKVWIVQNAYMHISAGSGQYPTIAHFQLVDPTGSVNQMPVLEAWTAFSSLPDYFFTSNKYWVIPPTYGVRASAVFNSGISSNLLYSTLLIWELPRGNWKA